MLFYVKEYRKPSLHDTSATPTNACSAPSQVCMTGRFATEHRTTWQHQILWMLRVRLTRWSSHLLLLGTMVIEFRESPSRKTRILVGRESFPILLTLFLAWVSPCRSGYRNGTRPQGTQPSCQVPDIVPSVRGINGSAKPRRKTPE